MPQPGGPGLHAGHSTVSEFECGCLYSRDAELPEPSDPIVHTGNTELPEPADSFVQAVNIDAAAAPYSCER